MFHKERQWYLELDGKHYSITFKQGGFPAKHILDINGTPKDIISSDPLAIIAVDYPFMLGEKQAHFVLIGNKADIAVDGVYLDSKVPYKSLKRFVPWVWPFLIGCLSICVLSRGNLAMILLGLLSAGKCFGFSVQPSSNRGKQIALCLGTVAVSLILFVLYSISNGTNIL